MIRHLIPLVAALGLVALPVGTTVAQAAPSATQVIELSSGWNLISLQVGAGMSPAQFQAALGLSDAPKLRSIWGFGAADAPGGAPWQWRFHRTDANQPNDLLALEPGKGYWVDVSGYCRATLVGAPWNGSISLSAGWNLVGFPGLHRNDSELQQLPDVFGEAFDRITQVWKWDASGSQRFVGYDVAAIPQVNDLPGVEPGAGYWVYALEPVVLAPHPYIALPADSDASPPQPAEAFSSADPRYLGSDSAPYVGRQVRYRSPDDSDDRYDLNENGILDDAYTQNTILFEVSSDTVSITIGNDGGGGILDWSLENSVDWLFTAPADDRTWPDGATSRPKSASGTVSSERDSLALYADRSGMTPGLESGSITLWVGGQAFPISLLLDVAPVDGDWRGFATTTRVGGRNISIGEVRLVLNSFSLDGDEANGFRAVLNREQSILFPRDVYMDGVFYSANQFKLTTNFEMPAGDRNAPPYDVFSPSLNPKDRDTNGDGKVDVMNPFPFGIRREVTLLGTRVSPDRLEGTYIESIRGMMPPLSGNTLVTDQNQFQSNAFLTQSQPVFIEGTFVLERQTFTPTKRSVFNESADLGLNIGGSDATSRSVTFDVTTPVTVQGVTLTLNLTFPDSGLIQITLIGPNQNDNPYVIHEFGDGSAIPSTVVIPDNIFTGAGNGTWTLQIDWDDSTGERGTLASWGLNIEGASTHQATARIVTTGAMPVEVIEGASIRLEGGVTTQTFASAVDGTFTIPALTENDYTLFISKPGFQTTTYTFFISENDEALGDIVITPLPITEPRLTAAPPIGYAGTQPLHVEFTVDLPLNFSGTNVAWDFGDGSAVFSGLLSDSVQWLAGDDTSNRSLLEGIHQYSTPGIYTATVTLSGGIPAITPIVKTQVIHVHRGIADPAGSTQQLLVSGFVGAFGARADAGANTPAADPAGVTEVAVNSVTYLGPSPVNLTSGFVFQESIWDTANLDLDRIPLAPGSPFPGPEDLDLTPSHPALRYVRFNTNSPNPIKYEALGYNAIAPYPAAPSGSKAVETANAIGFTTYTIPSGTTKPNRFRIATTLGGAVFATEPSAVGDIQIQPGRTLP